MKSFGAPIFVSTCFSPPALAQSPVPVPAPSDQITPQVLAEMLRSATTFHDLVRVLNKNLGPDARRPGPDGIPQHSMESTATSIGAGAGVGAAIGGMTHNQNGLLIGAMIGGAGGLIFDQILKHREEAHPKPIDAPVLGNSPGPAATSTPKMRRHGTHAAWR